ncbi:MAG: acyl-coenzyme A thioesterase PaaI-like protein [Bacteroidia bacterium]|jgi:acyl-coenzyme A thioesterase PaaI-like protein
MRSKIVKQLQWKVFLFGLFKIPLIGFCRPRIEEISESSISVKIPLNRRTRNHVKSMYLGVMTVGADLASGFLAYYLLETKGLTAAPVFKSLKAEYFKRAEDAVYFVCNEGQTIQSMIQTMEATKERVNQMITVKAVCKDELVAQFEMELSMKLRS